MTARTLFIGTKIPGVDVIYYNYTLLAIKKIKSIPCLQKNIHKQEMECLPPNEVML